VLLSTHDPDHAFSVGNRVALLDAGRLIAQGPPADVLTPARLRAVYGVSVVVERLSQGQTVCAPDYDVPSPRSSRGEGEVKPPPNQPGG
jgi:iron complex transport system ATP-binding protein